MSVSRRWVIALACLATLGCASTPASEPALNTLTAAERAEGWRLLFDGSTTTGWRNFQSTTIDPRWQAADGALTVTAAGGGDIVTVDQYENFELQFDWKIAPAGNSGVFFNVVEGDHDTVYRTGPEMQILDDARHSDGALPSHRAGANYDLHPARVPAAFPVGEFNQVRLIVNRGHVQQWLNGQLVVEYDLWTPEWRALVAASKFKDMPDYGLAHSGHIALQDHGDQVWFRNIKIKRL